MSRKWNVRNIIATFAKIGINGIVLKVVSVNNEVIKDDAGN